MLMGYEKFQHFQNVDLKSKQVGRVPQNLFLSKMYDIGVMNLIFENREEKLKILSRRNSIREKHILIKKIRFSNFKYFK